MNCRHCKTPLVLPFVDLGAAPPSNAYLTKDSLARREIHYPLKVMVCSECRLVQTEDTADAEDLFDADYAYFSSFSVGWVKHAESYVEAIVNRFGLGPGSHVVEVAANDGYLLQFVKQRGIPCTGVEPTASTAAAARAKGIDIVQEFFGVALANRLADEERQADLMAANNVLAHVPDINDFVAGFARLLKPEGVATFEFPHLLNLLRENQFDTIYHEHFSYLSLSAVERIFESNGLTVFDVETLPTHGGSLRVFARRSDGVSREVSQAVAKVLESERQAGMMEDPAYTSFQARANNVKDDFVSFLIEAKRKGKRVAAYGAAAKGNTLMNYAGIRPDLVCFVVDLNPAKQNKFMPGSRIPIVAEKQIRETRPDYVVILPWNLRDEIIGQLGYISEWGGRFVTAIPELTVLTPQ